MKNYDIFRSKLIIIPVLLASVVASVYLLQIILVFLSQFNWLFIIFIYSYIIYVLIAPINAYMQKYNVPEGYSLYFTYLSVFTILVVSIIILNPILSSELVNLSQKLNEVNFNTSLDDFFINFGHIFNVDPTQLKSTVFDNVKSFGVILTTNLFNIFSNAIFTLVQLLLALLFSFFLIKDGRNWFNSLIKLIPVGYRFETKTIIKYFNKNATAFLRVQILMAFLYASINYIIMNILGISFSLSSSLVAFITFIIPGVGPILSILVPVVITLLFNINKIIILVILLLLVQQIVLNILMPRLYGNQVGVHPIVIILSILVGIQLFGILGAFIAIPVMTVLINVIGIYINKIGDHSSDESDKIAN